VTPGWKVDALEVCASCRQYRTVSYPHLCPALSTGYIDTMIRFSLPLPGPFYWTPTRRIRVHRSFRHTALYWLFGVWFELSFWMLIGAALVAVAVAAGAVRFTVLGIKIGRAVWADWLSLRPRVVGRHRH
jgi:hypothetical protein